jgi:hypothetical protein
MRVPILIFILALVSAAPAICESSAGENLERVVRSFLDSRSGPIMIEGPMEKALNQSGDNVAVVVTKVIADRNLTPGDLNRILLLIRMSFAAPRIVESESDRQPRTTLFVLKYLGSLPAPPELKRKIAETRSFVQESAKSSATGHPR